MNKEIWVSVISLIFMTCFTIFSTLLYFQKRSILNNVQIFEGEYSDMGFEYIDSHLLIGTDELQDQKHNQKETYSIRLAVKYREDKPSTVKIVFNGDYLNMDNYKDTIIYYEVINQFNSKVKEKTELKLEDDKITLYSEQIEYSKIDYIYTLNFEIYNIYDGQTVQGSNEIMSSLSADLV